MAERNEFETRITARDEASRVFDRVADNAERAGRRMQRAGNGGGFGGAAFGALRGAAGGVLGFGGAVLGAGAAAGGAGIAAFTALTSAAVQQAGKIERLTATYGALSGSMGKAAQQMRFIQRFAVGALGEFDDLAEAGTLLEASGVRLERVLPIVSNIAGAFGASRENVLSLASAFGRLASGQSGEALERLREFGITRAALEQRGIRFSGGGQLLSSAREAFTAIEQISREKFGNIGKFMTSTLEQGLSNLSDRWGQLLDSMGRAWFPFLKGLIGRAGDVLGFLTDGGIARGIGARFAGSLQTVFGGDALERFAFTIVATLERLPELAQRAGQFLVNMAQLASQAFTDLYNAIGRGVTNTLNALGGGFNSLRGFAQQYVAGGGMGALPGWLRTLAPQVGFADTGLRHIARMGAYQQRSFTPIASPAEGIGRLLGQVGLSDTVGGIGQRADELMAQFRARGGNGGNVGPFGDFFNNSFIEAQKEQTRAVRENTEEVKKQTDDLRRQGFGGGELARLGVTPAELFGGAPQIRRALRARIQIEMANAIGGGNTFNARAF